MKTFFDPLDLSNPVFIPQKFINDEDSAFSITPVERRGQYFVKRDDLFKVAGVRGGKVRTCWYLAQGAKGLITAGSRSSPQVNIVAHIAQRLGIPARCHVPSGKLFPEVEFAKKCGAKIIQHKPGYNSVIVARAREDARQRKGWVEIPFGMECWEAVRQTAWQVQNIDIRCERIVVPVGSGMTLAGILQGLKHFDLPKIPVKGIIVGADPIKRLNKYAPIDWHEMVTIDNSSWKYHEEFNDESFGLPLDPIYEAKCLPHVYTDDLLWIVGIRQSLLFNLGLEKNWH